jgi:hypothetical protein
VISELPETEENLKALAFRSKLIADFRHDVAMGDVEGGMARYMNALSGPGAGRACRAPAGIPSERRDSVGRRSRSVHHGRRAAEIQFPCSYVGWGEIAASVWPIDG